MFKILWRNFQFNDSWAKIQKNFVQVHWKLNDFIFRMKEKPKKAINCVDTAKKKNNKKDFNTQDTCQHLNFWWCFNSFFYAVDTRSRFKTPEISFRNRLFKSYAANDQNGLHQSIDHMHFLFHRKRFFFFSSFLSLIVWEKKNRLNFLPWNSNYTTFYGANKKNTGNILMQPNANSTTNIHLTALTSFDHFFACFNIVGIKAHIQSI